MTEQELGKRLLQASAANDARLLDGRQLTAQILERDRRRIRLLGAATFMLLLLGTAGITYVLHELSLYMPPYMAFQEEKAGTRTVEKRQDYQEGYMKGVLIGLAVTASSLAVLALASLGTLLLVLDTRRATLRQINSSLALISERLDRLGQLREREHSEQIAQGNSHAHRREV
jgi:hypothetical protein